MTADTPSDWPAIADARRRLRPRADVWLDGRRIGSVAEDDLASLARWPGRFARDERGVHLTVPASERNDALAEVHAALRDEGRILAWRNEPFGLLDPATGAVLATIERAACRFWGSLTRGAHCNGYVADPADPAARPTHLWISRRATTKATDPGRLDNLVGGGVPADQDPHQTLLREGWEEAGLTEARMRLARPGRVIAIDADVREGRMVEHNHVYDLDLPPGLRPVNQDGEVDEIRLMPVAEAAERAASGEFTTDAALVTLDFLLRHALLPPAESARLAARAQHLWHR